MSSVFCFDAGSTFSGTGSITFCFGFSAFFSTLYIVKLIFFWAVTFLGNSFGGEGCLRTTCIGVVTLFGVTLRGTAPSALIRLDKKLLCSTTNSFASRVI